MMPNGSFPQDYRAASDLLKDRVILVTGAGAGIGQVAARTFAAHGATVILLGRTVEKLEGVYDEILAIGAAEPAIVPMDLNQLTQEVLVELNDAVEENYGRLDGILHNAGLLGERVPVEHYNTGLWQQVMEVNFNSVVTLNRTLLPLLRASESASLVHTSSGVGVTPRAYWGPYAVSKYALEGYAQLLADELENTSNIRVTVVNPGATRTQMRAAAYPNEDPKSLKTSEELMPLYLYLMGSGADDIHGHRFNA